MSEKKEWKIVELREMGDDELINLITDLKSKLFDLRFQHSIHQLDDPMKIFEVKREIECIETVLNERKATAEE